MPSTFADPANTFHEKAMLCRAAENTCYFVSVNIASAGSPSTSAVVRPDGRLLCYQPYGEEGLLVLAEWPNAFGHIVQRHIARVGHQGNGRPVRQNRTRQIRPQALARRHDLSPRRPPCVASRRWWATDQAVPPDATWANVGETWPGAFYSPTRTESTWFFVPAGLRYEHRRAGGEIAITLPRGAHPVPFFAAYLPRRPL